MNGRDAAALSDEQYWSLFAVVDQEPYFFQDTIRHNLTRQDGIPMHRLSRRSRGAAPQIFSRSAFTAT